MKIGYGYNVSSTSDRYISIAERALGLFAAATIPGAHLVDIIPCCKLPLFLISSVTDSLTVRYIPGVTTSKVAKEGRAALMEMVERPFGDVKNSLQQVLNDDDEEYSFVAASLRAGVDNDDHIQVSSD